VAEIILFQFQAWLRVKYNTEIITKLFQNNVISHVTSTLDSNIESSCQTIKHGFTVSFKQTSQTQRIVGLLCCAMTNSSLYLMHPSYIGLQ